VPKDTNKNKRDEKNAREYGLVARGAGKLARYGVPIAATHIGNALGHPIAGDVAAAAASSRGKKMERVTKDKVQDVVDKNNKEWEEYGKKINDPKTPWYERAMLMQPPYV
jgi:hypothetical protein